MFYGRLGGLFRPVRSRGSKSLVDTNSGCSQQDGEKHSFPSFDLDNAYSWARNGVGNASEHMLGNRNPTVSPVVNSDSPCSETGLPGGQKIAQNVSSAIELTQDVSLSQNIRTPCPLADSGIRYYDSLTPIYHCRPIPQHYLVALVATERRPTKQDVSCRCATLSASSCLRRV